MTRYDKSMTTRKIKRTSCGFCQTQNDSRHKNCPGTIRGASGGSDWTCWCSESGHPGVLPEAPVTQVLDDEPQGDREVRSEATPGTSMPETPEGPEAPSRAPKGEKKEKAPRCGAPTGKGPCKRVEGHTRGHDAR